MFSLLVTIISIALVAALAVATLYYSSNAYGEYQTRAAAAQVLNDSQQLSGAITLFQSKEGRPVSDLAELVETDYLSVLPGGAWQVVEGGVARTDLSENQCLAANKQLGINAVPVCDDPAIAGLEVCCSMPE